MGKKIRQVQVGDLARFGYDPNPNKKPCLFLVTQVVDLAQKNGHKVRRSCRVRYISCSSESYRDRFKNFGEFWVSEEALTRRIRTNPGSFDWEVVPKS